MPVVYKPEQEIRVLVNKNPKRPNTRAHQSFEKYRSGMTVADYLGAGGSRGDLSWDCRHSFISVQDPSKPRRSTSAPARVGKTRRGTRRAA